MISGNIKTPLGIYFQFHLKHLNNKILQSGFGLQYFDVIEVHLISFFQFHLDGQKKKIIYPLLPID
jgi:hypothetical protein